MKIFVAGASGAIGQPLIAELVRRGHTVTGMTHSERGARLLADIGAIVANVSAFDAPAVEEAVRRSQAETVIDELTALPKHPAELPAALPGDRKLRLEGGGNLYRAALSRGVRRYIQQASGFFLKAGSGLADESEPLAVDASAGVAASAQMYTQLEARVFSSPQMEGVALRYGFFYGPNTWYFPGEGAADQVLRQQFPIVGQGKVCGPLFMLRTRLLPRSPLSAPNRASTTSLTTIHFRYAAGCQISRDGLALPLHPRSAKRRLWLRRDRTRCITEQSCVVPPTRRRGRFLASSRVL